MKTIENPWRGQGLVDGVLAEIPGPSVDAAAPLRLLAQCPAHGVTPLERREAWGTALWVKDERGRMGLGSFKALGAAYVIAHEAAATGADDMANALAGRTYVTASAGNHGMSVAAGAKVFGAKAVVYIAETVPEGFAGRLRDMGAEVVREGADYEASMKAAETAASDNGWTLLSDSSWPGYLDLPWRLMEGYLVMAEEAVRQMPEAPTHVFLQAGVGGLAGACAALFRQHWGDGPRIVVVEPEAAPALQASIEAGRPVVTHGPVSAMGRLDCKAPSLIALRGLSRDADDFVTITEEEAAEVLPELKVMGLESTESGSAGLAAAKLAAPGPGARVLCILSEQAET
ncbi:MAG: pyridoxal-phosphate dependent enzyme [Roseovarius sp.]